MPNISEGRDLKIIEKIRYEIEAVPGTRLLQVSSDPDHNRSVFTFVGSRHSLKTAIRKLFAVAVKHIDLRSHEGVHPRMGAVDVVPFIPLLSATMQDCIDLSRDVAESIAGEFSVPAFLYAESATSPGHRMLSNIRKGGFEGMAAKMRRPEWMPDFGPQQPHPSAGVTAFGARKFLIAYNILLDTTDVNIAKQIARAVRASSGGLPHVQAMGVFLEVWNVAQVSMNLLDYEQTPIHQVQERVKLEAARLGVRIIGAEIVGLAPQAALIDAAAHYLEINHWSGISVLENTLFDTQFRQPE